MAPLLTDVDLLSRLVAFDSTSSNSNILIADFIASYVDVAGVRVVRNPSEDGTKTNLVAIRGTLGDDRAGLVLSGHMDTVPALERSWESDPFTLTDRGDRFVGRGTADMKAFLAIALNAFLRAKSVRHPLALVLTYDEEVGTVGAHRLVRTWDLGALPAKTIIGEPTSLRVVRMHKGHLKTQIDVRGRSAHSAHPYLGRNAIEIAGRIIDALARLRVELEAERNEHHEFFVEVPFVPINVGTIRGGTAINIVPDHCTIELGVRLLPGMSTAAMVERLRDAISRVATADEAALTVMSDSPPLLLRDDAPIHRELCDLVGQTESLGVNYATDAGWLQELGMECVLFGPGSIEVAHRPNEYVPKADIERAPAIVDAAIARNCA